MLEGRGGGRAQAVLQLVLGAKASRTVLCCSCLCVPSVLDAQDSVVSCAMGLTVGHITMPYAWSSSGPAWDQGHQERI